MANVLSTDRVVRTEVNLSPKATPRRNFGVLMIVSADDAIDQGERYRSYTSLDGAVQDLGSAGTAYPALELYFSQSPQPSVVMVGRWVRTPAPALLKGGLPAEADLDVSAWQTITDGSLSLIVTAGDAPEGVTVTGLDFSGQTNLNGVAGVISAALNGYGVNCAWDGEKFVLSTLFAGAGNEIGFATAAGSGTDISAKAALTAALALPPVPGMEAETPLECVTALADISGEWYGLAFGEVITRADHIAVSGFVEASGRKRVNMVTETNSRALSAQVADDLPSTFKALSRSRTFTLYSRNPNAAVSAAGRAFTVNFNGSNTTITLKFKQLPGVVAEGLKESQAQALTAKNCNYFANYDNDTAILEEGVMGNGAFFDEIHGLDWLENAIQTDVYNLLYQSTTKIGQTDDDINQIVTVISDVMGAARKNGLIAPGVWNADGFGLLERGQYLPEGYYIYTQSVDDQAQTEREQRKTPPIQIAAKLKGAVHSTDIILNVNR